MCNKTKRSTRAVAGSLVVGTALAWAAPLASAGIVTPATGMQSTGTCLYSEQLQTSAEARNKYLTMLRTALGSTAGESSTVEGTTGSVIPASDTSAEKKVDLTGGAVKETADSTGIDTLSAGCLQCHDGAAAVAVSANVRNDPYHLTQVRSGSDHPIGMDYQLYVNAGRGFKSAALGGGKMVFIDGKVGCLTCHNPLNRDRGHLVMSDTRSSLCLTCHDK